jgi:hypothetical protein
MPTKLFVKTMVALGLLLGITDRSHGMGSSNQGSTISWICSRHNSMSGGGFFSTWFVDPVDVQGFKLDIQFNPTQLEFLGIDYISPYVETTPPNFSQLGSGRIFDIAGDSSISPPPPGEVFLFDVRFRALEPGSPGTFSLFADSNAFIIGYDRDTGQTTKYGSETIDCPCDCALPEPGSLSLLGTGGVVALLGYGWRRKRAAA